MIDQEGGTVTRLRTQVPLPSALALGKMDDTKFTQGFGGSLFEALLSSTGAFRYRSADLWLVDSPKDE